jgi:tetratricopeptide (TPR) repeat protein
VLATYRRSGGDDDALIARCRLNLADALRRAGRADEALAHAGEAFAQLDPLLPARSAFRGYARTVVARVLVATGRASEAVPALEESLANYPVDDINPYLRALTQATLAQAIFAVDGDRVRARELARTARATLARASAGWASEREALDRWLAALPPELP